MKHESDKRQFNIGKDGLHLKVNKHKMLLQTNCARKLYYSRISGIRNNNKLMFSSEHLIFTVTPMCQKFLPYFEQFHERFYIISFIFEKIKNLVT